MGYYPTFSCTTLSTSGWDGRTRPDLLGYCFRPPRAKNSQDASVFCSFCLGQPFGAEVYARGNPGFEPPKTDPCVNG